MMRDASSSIAACGTARDWQAALKVYEAGGELTRWKPLRRIAEGEGPAKNKGLLSPT